MADQQVGARMTTLAVAPPSRRAVWLRFQGGRDVSANRRERQMEGSIRRYDFLEFFYSYPVCQYPVIIPIQTLRHTPPTLRNPACGCMYGCMTDHLSILRDRIEKADSKVQRYKKSLETAESELSDLITALRVLEGITNGGDSNGSGTPATMGRQLEILRMLSVGRDEAQSPADLYKTYSDVGSEDIAIDTFRTTIWRMKDKTFEADGSVWGVHGDSGNYWKELLREVVPNDPIAVERLPWERRDPEPNWGKADD